MNVKNRAFLFTGWKSLWSLATRLVISDRYIGELILQLSIDAMASHSNSTKPLPQLRTEYIYSYHRHQQRIMYVQSLINDYRFIHRISVSFSGASTYNRLSRIKMLCCCTHDSLVKCNHSYMIPQYDALYDLKRQWYNEFLPFLSYQPGTYSRRRCPKMLHAPNVRVGKTCIRSWFLVSISCKLLLYWNIDRK